MDVCCECCVLSGRGLCDGLITRPEESYRLWCVVVCDLETSWMRRSWPTGGLLRQKQTKNYIDCIPVVRHPEDVRRTGRNVLVKNSNMLLKVCIKVHLLVYQVSKRLWTVFLDRHFSECLVPWYLLFTVYSHVWQILFFIIYLFICLFILGDRGSTVVKVLCYKSEGRWFDSSWCQWNFSLT